MAPMASLVCRVENTLCPVMAARMAIKCRVVVADLADEHDIRILAQESPHPIGEIQARRLADLCLADERQLILYRILEGHDIDRAAC